MSDTGKFHALAEKYANVAKDAAVAREQRELHAKSVASVREHSKATQDQCDAIRLAIGVPTSEFKGAIFGCGSKMPEWGVHGETPEEGAWPVTGHAVPPDAVIDLTNGKALAPQDFSKLANWTSVPGYERHDGRTISRVQIKMGDGKEISAEGGTLAVPKAWNSFYRSTLDALHIKYAGHGTETTVTPEMLAAASMVTNTAVRDALHGEDLVTAIYRAMHAVAPVELVSEGERQAVRERDALQSKHDDYRRTVLEQLAAARADRDEALGHLRRRQLEAQGVDDEYRQLEVALDDERMHRAACEKENVSIRTELMAARDRPAVDDPRYDVVSRVQYIELQGEVMELKDKYQLALDTLAKFNTVNVGPIAPRKPEHDPFREFPRDPRKMGPI